MRAHVVYQAVESVIKDRQAANADVIGDGERTAGMSTRTSTSISLKLVWPKRRGSPESQGEHPAGVTETFSVIEDVWLRLAACEQVTMGIDVDGDDADMVLRCRLIHGTVDEEVHGLPKRASERDTYAWSQEGRQGSFVSFIEWEQGELVIGITPISQIRRWPDGANICWQWQELLHRLKARSQH